MNLHVIFVHFPIAFFTIYALAEMARFDFITRQLYWFYIKAVLVIIGALSAVVTITTGLLIEDLMEGHPALEYHEFFAWTTFGIFLAIALSYAFAWLGKVIPVQNRFWKLAVDCGTKIVESKWIIILAMLGLISVTITGGLGGVMAFGEKSDPFFGFFYRLFIK